MAARQNASSEEQERALEVARQWKRDNHEMVVAQKAAWDAANPEKVSAYSRRASAKFRAANPELAKARVLASVAKNPDYYREAAAQWQRDNPEKCRAKYKQYMTAKMNAYPAWADYDKILEFYAEAQRMQRETLIEHAVDHIVPLQGETVCGLHCQDNLQVITGSENSKKGNRFWPDQWPRWDIEQHDFSLCVTAETDTDLIAADLDMLESESDDEPEFA